MNFAAKLYVSPNLRRSDRQTAGVDGTLRGRGGQPLDVRVVDISPYGFRCITTADLREGDAVTLGLRGNGDGAAIVRWRRGAQIGCAFVRPLSESEAHAAISADVVVAVAQWARSGLLGDEAIGPTLSPARLFTTLLAVALLADLVNGYLERVL